jgi:hypothetical protein
MFPRDRKAYRGLNMSVYVSAGRRKSKLRIIKARNISAAVFFKCPSQRQEMLSGVQIKIVFHPVY